MCQLSFLVGAQICERASQGVLTGTVRTLSRETTQSCSSPFSGRPEPARSAQDVLEDVASQWQAADRANDLGPGTPEFVEFTQQKLGEIFRTQ